MRLKVDRRDVQLLFFATAWGLLEGDKRLDIDVENKKLLRGGGVEDRLGYAELLIHVT